MPVATPEQYGAMLDAAKAGGYAFPAINVTSSETLNAALEGFAEAESDGIIQISTGGGSFASGLAVNDMAFGARALIEFGHIVAERYPIHVAFHTDHCQADKVDRFIRPLLEETKRRRADGKGPLFQSHMFDGSAIPLGENLEISVGLLAELSALDVILEIEVGVVGGEEDGVSAEGTTRAMLYTTNEDLLLTAEKMGLGENGRYLLAATFGNVHGVYKPGNVKLRPSVLKDGQEALEAKYGPDASFDYVFHGGSGSELHEIHEAISYGVVKMNIDTDTQYAFTRPIAGHMMSNYDGVLKVDGEVGNKKVYDPRSYLKKAEAAMAERVIEACNVLKSVGHKI